MFKFDEACDEACAEILIKKTFKHFFRRHLNIFNS